MRRGLLIPLAAVALVAVSGTSAVARSCTKTYTLPMFQRAARATYSGDNLPRKGAYAHLWRYARCQRVPRHVAVALRYWHRQQQAWARRRHPPMNVSLASWYEDGGATASGFHAGYGVAHKTYAFGTRVEICYPRDSTHCVTATVDDRGPFIPGREWDLNQTVAGALGFGGVSKVSWRIL